MYELGKLKKFNLIIACYQVHYGRNLQKISENYEMWMFIIFSSKSVNIGFKYPHEKI